MLKIILSVLVLTLSSSASAALISSSGGVNIFGTVYVDNDAVGDGSNSQAQGIGNVTEIRNSNGDLVWDNSVNEVSLVFHGWDRDQLQAGIGGTTQFTSINGFAGFFINPLGTFAVTGDYAVDSVVLSTGSLVLETIGAMSGFGNTAVGQFSQTGYASNGYVDVVSSAGLFGGLFENSAVDAGNGATSNMTFNISGDNLSTAGYDFSGTGDLSGVATVPAPQPFILMVMGLMSLFTHKIINRTYQA